MRIKNRSERRFDAGVVSSATCLDATIVHRPTLPDFSLVLEGYRSVAAAWFGVKFGQKRSLTPEFSEAVDYAVLGRSL